MAKTGGSLFGKADAALVAAAYREGMTRGPGDLSGVYKLDIETNKMMWETIQENFDKAFGENIALKEKLETTTDDLMSEFTGGTSHDKEMMVMIDDYVKTIRKDLEGKDDKSLEARESYNELERLKNRIRK